MAAERKVEALWVFSMQRKMDKQAVMVDAVAGTRRRLKGTDGFSSARSNVPTHIREFRIAWLSRICGALTILFHFGHDGDADTTVAHLASFLY